MITKCLKYLMFAFGLLFSLNASADVVKSLFHHEQDPVAGNPKGSVTVVEFFDYQCSHCINMAPVISAIIKANPKVRIVFKEYPIRGPMSEIAARAALAANMQGKYYEFNHALMTTSLAMNENNILDIAKSMGLNVKKLKKDMNSSTVTNVIQANYALARELNLTGTPAFFVGKTNAKDSKNLNFTLGEMSQTELQDAINHAI
ncbi:Thiol:disulfide interchange protein DsbA [Aquicella siphonis]|uniref:Thiol:disulfide interchange protein DsbA n=1 Tax=Aquicella siphonis TaxID=254247 RepID=A0A5E4PK28_9COXI|nr:DsbA family protein [Aquicella siphonis]VVC76741.1 Thiol:disulfide interchange protein DsbA [Aquicella siphonis]